MILSTDTTAHSVAPLVAFVVRLATTRIVYIALSHRAMRNQSNHRRMGHFALSLS